MILARSRNGDGSPLVLVHGSGTDRTRWAPVTEPLARRFAVHAIDRRGHGDSTEPPGYDYRIEDEFDDLALVLDEIGDRRTIVVGHSYGALCALGAACRGAPLAGLVLYEPPLPAAPGDYCPPGLVEAMREEIDFGRYDEAAAIFATAVLGISEAEIARRRRLGLWRGMAEGVPIILRELESVDRLAMQASRFASCHHPTLLLLGGDSPPEYRATAHALAAALPDSRIQTLSGQGHRAIDTAPEIFAAAVLDFAATTAALQAN